MSNRSRRHPTRYPPQQAQQGGGIANAVNMNQGQQGGVQGNNPVQPAAAPQGNNPAQPAAAAAQGSPNIAAIANLSPAMQQAIFAAIASVVVIHVNLMFDGFADCD